MKPNFQPSQRDPEFEKLRQNQNYMVFQLEEPSTKLYLKNLLLFLFFFKIFFKESKLGPKVLLRNRNCTTLVQTPIFVRGNPQHEWGTKASPSQINQLKTV
jgi:hypothetical protein